MKVYNQTKTEILTTYDLEKGYLKDDKLFIAHHEAQPEVKEMSHYVTIKEFSNGGKEVRKIVDVPHKPAKPAYDEYENIKIFIPYTIDEYLERQKNVLREWRKQWFSVIDCAVWYDCLTQEEKEQVKQFRFALLDITKTMTKPTIPACVQARL